MKQINNQITVVELSEMSKNMYGDIVKAVVDLEKHTMVVDAEFHADEEQDLIKSGSIQQNLWGINLRPELYGTDDFIEFDSMINIRPNQNNPTRNVINTEIRNKIILLVNSLVIK